MTIDDIKINYNYTFVDKEHDTIVLLHGWGQNTIMMQPIEEYFKSNFNVLNIDLPGFGKSTEPKEVLNVTQYANIVYRLITELGLSKTKISIVGHSFGGRIAIVYASLYKIERVILCSAPFLKRIKKDSFKLRTLKMLKKLPLIRRLEPFAKKRIGSTDYKNASEIMRKILVETVNEDLTDNVKKIKCPVILIYGQLDKDVPIEEGKQLEELLSDGYLVTYPYGTHYAYFEDIVRTNKIIESFMKG